IDLVAADGGEAVVGGDEQVGVLDQLVAGVLRVVGVLQVAEDLGEVVVGVVDGGPGGRAVDAHADLVGRTVVVADADRSGRARVGGPVQCEDAVLLVQSGGVYGERRRAVGRQRQRGGGHGGAAAGRRDGEVVQFEAAEEDAADGVAVVVDTEVGQGVGRGGAGGGVGGRLVADRRVQGEGVAVIVLRAVGVARPEDEGERAVARAKGGQDRPGDGVREVLLLDVVGTVVAGGRGRVVG